MTAEGKAPRRPLAPSGGTTVFRLVKAKHAAHAFDGEGARRFGGRFNPPGVAVVYTAAHLSLAVLELFVHLDPGDAPEDLVSIAARLPPSLGIARLEVSDLPADWRSYPAPERLRELGAEWVRAGRTAALTVPSAVVPREENILLNPAHPDFGMIEIGEPEAFSFDPRMWKAEAAPAPRSRPAR